MHTMNTARIADYLAEWLKERVEQSKTQGTVVNNSGGVDSAVTIGLCVRAGLPTITLVQPCQSQEEDMRHAHLVAEGFGVPCLEVNLDKVFDEYRELLGRAFAEVGEDREETPALANIKPRLRMVSQYYFANRLNYLAVGTSNLSELTVGYFTKHGDGASDILPLGSLVKREVYELARFLGVPQEVMDKPPSAGLQPGQTDEGDLGLTYDQLDEYVRNGPVDEEVAERISALERTSAHKRRMPPVPVLKGEE